MVLGKKLGSKASPDKIRGSRFSVVVFQSWRQSQKVVGFGRKVLRVVSL